MNFRRLASRFLVFSFICEKIDTFFNLKRIVQKVNSLKGFKLIILQSISALNLKKGLRLYS